MNTGYIGRDRRYFLSQYIIFSAFYPPHVGGVDRYSEAIAGELASRGNDVLVITSQYDNLPAEEKVSEHLAILRIPSRILADGRMPVYQRSREWTEVKRRIRKIQNPRVIIQTFLYPLSLAASHIARKKHWDFVIINHGCNYVCQGNTWIDRAEHVYEEVLARRIVKGSKGCYSVSAEAGKWTEHFVKKTAGILHNSINVTETEGKLKSLPKGIKEEYGIEPGTYVIAFIGRMIREKGIYQLVEAVQQLLQEKADIALIAAGGGEELERIKENETDRIIFTDSIDHDEVLRILRECDCCCLPSDSEGLPTVLLEAALADCLLISSPYGGSPEVIDQYGIIMKDNTRESIYDALKQAICDKNKHMMIEECKDRIRKLFSWDSTCNQIEELFREKGGNQT